MLAHRTSTRTICMDTHGQKGNMVDQFRCLATRMWGTNPLFDVRRTATATSTRTHRASMLVHTAKHRIGWRRPHEHIVVVTLRASTMRIYFMSCARLCAFIYFIFVQAKHLRILTTLGSNYFRKQYSFRSLAFSSCLSDRSVEYSKLNDVPSTNSLLSTRLARDTYRVLIRGCIHISTAFNVWISY